jgi:hypothetical protein
MQYTLQVRQLQPCCSGTVSENRKHCHGKKFRRDFNDVHYASHRSSRIPQEEKAATREGGTIVPVFETNHIIANA